RKGTSCELIQRSHRMPVVLSHSVPGVAFLFCPIENGNEEGSCFGHLWSVKRKPTKSPTDGSGKEPSNVGQEESTSVVWSNREPDHSLTSRVLVTGLDVAHIHVNESNDSLENLGLTCRSYNIKVAHVMKRHGMGWRTRQYNPRGGGADTLAQWMSYVDE